MTDQTITLTLRADASGMVKVVGGAVDGVKTKLAQAGSATDAWKRQLGQIGNVAKAGFAALVAGAAAAGAGTIELVRRAANAADEMAKMSSRTGVAVEDLSRLGFAAKQSGTDLGGLEVGMKKLASELEGGGEQLARLGIASTNAAGGLRPMNDVLLDVADKFAGMQNGAEKAALAQQLFGKSGLDLLPMLNQGRAGIEALGDQAERLGLVISGETAVASERFNDAVSSLTSTAQGFANTLLTELAPEMANYAEQLVKGAEESGAFKTAAEAMATGLKVALLAVVLVKNALDAFITTTIGLVDIVATSFGAVGRIIGTVATSIRDALAAAFDLDAAGVKSAISGVGAKVEEIFLEAGNRIAESGGAVAAAWDESVGDVTNTIESLFGTYEDGAKAASALVTSTNRATTSTKDLAAASKAAKDADKDRTAALKDLQAGMEKLAGITQDYERQLAGPVQQAMMDYESAQQAITAAADEALAALEALGGGVEAQAQIYAQEGRALDLAAQAHERLTRAAEVEQATRVEFASVADAGLATLVEETRQLQLTHVERVTEAALLAASTQAQQDYIDKKRETIGLSAAEIAAIRAGAAAQVDGQSQIIAAQEAAAESQSTLISGVGNLATAVADFAVGGIKSFKDFGKAALNIARQTLADIIAMFLRNKILISIGIGGSGASGVAAAAQGQGGLLGGASNLLGGITQGGGVLGGLLGSTFGAVGGALAGFGGALGGLGAGMTIAGNAGLLAAGQFGVAQIAAGNLAVGMGALVPVIGWVVAAAAAINALSGGKLFGTSYRATSGTSTLSLGDDGGSASQSIREVRQRSLFGGRQWRTRDVAASDEATEAAQQLFDAVRRVMTDSARALQGEAPAMLEAALRTVQEYDSKGKVKATRYFVDVLGRSWEEASAEAAATRITAEAMISTIDAIIGTTVDAASAATAAAVEDLVGAAGDGAANAAGQAGASIFDTIVKSAAAAQGEASAIAERWRDDASVLMDGAQMLLAAAVDIRAGAGLLGEGGSLTQIAGLIEDLANEGESLVQAYARVTGSTRLLDQALAMSGTELDLTRAEFVRFAADIANAAGGLDRAAALWNAYFETFYSADERAAYALQQARANAATQAADIGLNATDFEGAAGAQAFRALFEAALPTLTAEAIVEWLEFAQALGVVIDMTGEATDAIDQVSGSLSDLMTSVTDQLAEFAPPATFAQQLAAINTETEAMIARATALGATEQQLAQIRELGAARVGAVLADQAAAYGQYADMVRGINDELAAASGMSEFAQSMRDIDRDLASMIANLNAAARAAGMQGAAEADLAAAHQLAAIRAAEAIARLEQSGRDIVQQLYGTQLERLDREIAEMQASAGAATSSWAGGMNEVTQAVDNAVTAQIGAQQRIRDWLDNLMIGDLGGLRPRDALVEAQALFDRTLASALGGDAEAMAALPGLADQLLRLGQRVYASGDPYFDLRDTIRDALTQVAAIPIETGLPNPGTGGGGFGGDTGGQFGGGDLAALIAQRDALAAEQAAAERRALATELAGVIRELIVATGRPLDDIAATLGVQMSDLVADLGVNLDTLTVATASQLGDIAQATGTELSALAASVGVDLGSLADRQSLLNDALEAEIAALPQGQRDLLEPLLRDVEEAAALGDTAGVEAGIRLMEDAIAGLSPDLRDALAPYFLAIRPGDPATEIDLLGLINGATASSLTELQQQTLILGEILAGMEGGLTPIPLPGTGGTGPTPPGYAVGTPFVPADGLAYLHRGEAVIPARVNAALRSAGVSGGTSDNLLVAELRELRRERRDADEYTRRLEQRIQQLETTTARGDADKVRAMERQTDAIKQRR